MNIFPILFFLLISFKKVINSSNFEIAIIPDANLNATAAFASLGESKEEFLYFSFDFNYHNQVSQKEKNVAFFKITTELNFSYQDINYILIDKNQEEINCTYFKSTNKIFWKPCQIIPTEKIYNEYNYFIQINKYGEKNIKNTLILRIPILKRKGDITIENLYSLPEEILEKANKYKNFNNWPIRDKNDMNIHSVEIIPPSHIRKHHYKYYYYEHNELFSIFGVILGVIWISILFLYCKVNRRNKNKLAVVIGNIQN